MIDLLGVDFHDFDIYQKRFTKEEIENRIKTYLEKDRNVKHYYEITPQSLRIGDLAQQQIDYVLHFSETSQPPKMEHKSKGSLKGVKIAIDPGHFGGIYAELEDRCINIPKDKTKDRQPINFNEGTLTYQTALLLKSLLEAEGAEVLITRPGIGQGSLREGFFEWLQHYPLLWKRGERLDQLFRNTYNRADLHARAQRINAFSPDLTVIIHYNFHLSDVEKAEESLLTSSNFNLVFVPGAFSGDELKSREDRYEFLRLLVTQDFTQSLKLGRSILYQFSQKLGIPPLRPEEKTSYTTDSCLFQESGIYSRNLVLTRLVHGPLCYGESLVQNNQDEIYRLGAKDIEVEGQLAPSRVKEVAEAYFQGIKSYLYESF